MIFIKSENDIDRKVIFYRFLFLNLIIVIFFVVEMVYFFNVDIYLIIF